MTSDNKKKQTNAGIARATGIISSATLLSRLLGFVRDMIIAMTFGSSLVADSFLVAFRLPNMFRELLAEGSISAAFIPVFTEYIEGGSQQEAKRFASAVFSILIVILLLVTTAGILFAPQIVRMVAPGFVSKGAGVELTVHLTRVMFPYLFFIGLAALAMGILNSIGIFAPPALSPAVYNIVLISSLLFMAPLFDNPVLGLATGVIMGGCCQFLIQVPSLIKSGYMFRFYRNPLSHPGVKKVGKLVLPVMIGLSATQVNLLVNTILASFLDEGSISYLYYSMRLIHFPLGIFGIAVATAVLPMMSRYAANNDTGGIISTTSFGLRLVLFITIPAMAGLIFMRVPIVSLVYQRGQFDYNSTIETARAVACYAVGLWSFAGVRIIIQAFYSIQDTATPVKVSIAAVLVNIAASLILIGPMKHAGLAIATVASSVFSILVLQYLLRKKLKWHGGKEIVKTTLQSLLSSLAIAGVAIYISNMEIWKGEHHVLMKAGILLPAVIGSVIVYLTCQYWLKNQEIMFLIDTIKEKNKKI